MKQITYRELLNLVHEGKQPKTVELNGHKYTWEDSTYKRNVCGGGVMYMSIESSRETEWVMANRAIFSYEETILDIKEAEYLSNIIQPFKKYIRYIVKIEIKGQEKIRICYKDYLDKEKDSETLSNYTFFGLPTFKKDTMYRGMDLNKEYSLEELGL